MFILPSTLPTPQLSKGTACVILRNQVLMSLLILAVIVFFLSVLSFSFEWKCQSCEQVVGMALEPSWDGRTNISAILPQVRPGPPDLKLENSACWLFFSFFFFFFFMWRSYSAWTMDKGIYGKFSALHYCNKKNLNLKKIIIQTGVSTRYSYTDSFCICCSIPEVCLILTMLFNVLVTFLFPFF
ncbi:hypothetical protein COCON_G00225880 [Conger conger]|uniref:Uncharacterized protein n=1 Tax=Conger conger TaxID=82655 RepID=A0A9Q1HNU1_CONCO|nr:hypothetical protein COCON_G00225880 [Conger conger]